MAWLNVGKAGELGLVPDLPPNEVPFNAWTSGRNVRMVDGEVASFPGHDLGAENTSGPIEVWSLDPVTSTTAPFPHFWVYVTEAGAFAFDGSVHHVITPTVPLTGTKKNVLTTCFLNGNLVICNGVDQPHFWDLNISNNLEIIPGWDANWIAGAITSHKGFLVALDITDTSVRRPYRVKWSDEAPPGLLPQSWDALDPTIQAGERDLGDTTAFLQLGLSLRDELMLYTEREVIGMQLIGGPLTWRFRTVAREAGCISRRGVSDFKGMHVMCTDQDVLLNDGQTVRSIIDNRNRRDLFGALDEDADHYVLTFVQTHRLANEVWVCFPTQNHDYCNRALVWNYTDNTWGQRDLPEGCIAAGDGIDLDNTTTIETWDNTVGDWDTTLGPWDLRSFNLLGGLLLLGGDARAGTGLTGAPIFRAEKGAQFNGVGREARIERIGLQLQPDERKVTITELWPRAFGGIFTVRVGYQEVPNGEVQWKVNKPFDPEQDRKVTFRMTGRYPCIAFESLGTDVNWRIHGYRLKYRAGAER